MHKPFVNFWLQYESRWGSIWSGTEKCLQEKYPDTDLEESGSKIDDIEINKKYC